MESSLAGGVLGDLVPVAFGALEVVFCSSASSGSVAWTEQTPLVLEQHWDRTTFHRLLCPLSLTLGEVCPLYLEGPIQQAGTHFLYCGTLSPRTDLCWWPTVLCCPRIPGTILCFWYPIISTLYFFSALAALTVHLSACLHLPGVSTPRLTLVLGPSNFCGPLSSASFMPCTWAVWQGCYWAGTLLDLWETEVLNTHSS